ncbi:MAG TPA: FG-GAP-like repeat-containing protein [Pyrinomonadaceae bacterium]|jgi:hypothetical protein
MLVLFVALVYSGESLRAFAACEGSVFTLARTYTTGRAPRAIAIADFNGDGKNDLAVANQSSANISILLGTGDGNFSAPTDFAIGTQPYSVVAADFNGDGKMDLAVGKDDPDAVLILLGTGTGSFVAQPGITVFANPIFMATGDFNNDSKTDLVVVADQTLRLTILLGTGTGTFGTPSIISLNADPKAVIVGDFNGDGKSDLAAAAAIGSDYRVAVLLGTGTGTFGAPSYFAIGGLSFSLVAGYFNNDTALDLAVATSGNTNLSILLGTGTGSFNPATNITLELTARSVVAGDFNGDGKTDLALAISGDSLNSSGHVSILHGNGDGSFGQRTNYNAGRTPYFIAAADLNGDTKSDLAVANIGDNLNDNGEVAILLATPGGAFSGSGKLLSFAPRVIVHGDFNSDGKIDIAALQSNSVGVFLGTGQGTFSGPTNFAFTGFPDGMAAGDFNNDGKRDVAVTTQSPNGVAVFLGTGAGGFTGPTVLSAGSIPYGVTVADFNADGKSDLAVANAGANNVSIYLGDGTGGFGGPTSFATAQAPAGLVTGDFNADGKTDLAVGSSGSVISILLGTGTGSFSGPTNFAAGQTPEAVVTGDFNADGKADLAVANRNSSRVTILLGSGTGTFGSPSGYIVGGNPFDLEVGDFNGDGKTDLAVPNYTLNLVSILQGTGTGTFIGPAYYPTGINPIGVAVGDYDNDGRSDMAVANLTGNSITILLNGCIGAATSLPSVSINDATITEGDAGVTGSAMFTVSLSAASSQTVTVRYSTVSLLPSFASSYQPASGTLTFAPGETTKLIPIQINGDTEVESNELFFISLTTPVNALVADGLGTGTILDDDIPQTIQFGQASYAVSEGAGFLNITVTRSGSTADPASVKYFTSDATDANFRCDPNTAGQSTGVASRKCDYHIAVGTLRFAAGETTKQFTLSVVDDVYVEGAETFMLTLTNPIGVPLGQNVNVPITIQDNDTTPGAANPIDDTRFFVRQLYVDLLSREPDPAGWQGWTTRIDQCGQPGQPPPPCDRVTVAGDGFLRSGEFFDRQFFVIRLYRTGLGRILRYDEVGDLAFVSGFLTAEQLELNKQDLVNEIITRGEFASRYNVLNNGQYVDTLLQTAGVAAEIPASVRQGWITALETNTRTRAQVYREISERQEVSHKYAHEAQVVSAYYGFFTRNPDGAYLNYLQRLDSGEITLGDLANAFVNAAEYRSRFGQ